MLQIYWNNFCKEINSSLFHFAPQSKPTKFPYGSETLTKIDPNCIKTGPKATNYIFKNYVSDIFNLGYVVNCVLKK